MPVVRTLPNERHTLASALAPLLEERCPDDLVSCAHMHPLDDFIYVRAPSDAAIREALLALRAQVARARAEVQQAAART